MQVCKIRGGWSSLRVSGSVFKTTRGNNGKEHGNYCIIIGFI